MDPRLLPPHVRPQPRNKERLTLETLGCASVPQCTPSGGYNATMDHDRDANDRPSFIELRLWDQDALVLFDWLMSLDFDAVPVTHRAEKQALTDLLNQLEQTLPPGGATEEQFDAARAAVSRDMGWS